MSRSEQRLLLSALPAYLDHLAAHPHSLLCRFMGLHAITAPGGKKVGHVVRQPVRGHVQRVPIPPALPTWLLLSKSAVNRCRTPNLTSTESTLHNFGHFCKLGTPLHLKLVLCNNPEQPLSALACTQYLFVVMSNVFRSDHQQLLPLHRRYDLKGSTLGRTAGPAARSSSAPQVSLGTPGPDASTRAGDSASHHSAGASLYTQPWSPESEFDPDVILKDLDLDVEFRWVTAERQGNWTGNSQPAEGEVNGERKARQEP